MRQTHRSRFGAGLAIVLSMLCARSASAQDIAPDERAPINIQRFRPAVGPDGVFMTETSGRLEHLALSSGVLFNMATAPLSAASERDGEVPVVDLQLTANLMLSLGLFDIVDLAIDMPILVVNELALPGDDRSGESLGDLSLRPRATLLDASSAPVGIGVYTDLVVPTGNADAFASDDGLVLRAGIILDVMPLTNLRVALNAGAGIKQERSFGDLSAGNEVLFGLGVDYALLDGSLFLGAEVFGATPFDDFFGDGATPLDALAGVKYRILDGFQVEIGAGRGVLVGVGSTDLRVLAGVRYTLGGGVDEETLEKVEDLLGGLHYSPTQADWAVVGERSEEALWEAARQDEDPVIRQGRAISSLSHFETEDTRDFLVDFIADTSEPVALRRKAMLALAVAFGAKRQPNGQCAQREKDRGTLAVLVPYLDAEAPELRRGAVDAMAILAVPRSREALDARLEIETESWLKSLIKARLDGLVFADNGCPDKDADGFDDTIDACPDETEDKDGFEDEDGCPEPDNDQDGFLDADDKCPGIAGHPRYKGCPPTDDDNDGFKEDDECPDEPEDKDGFEDNDGCPDPDNDRDGILDVDDKCPDKPETLNGVKDEDGCPDRGRELVTKDLRIREKVFFDKGKATIQDRSLPLLGAVAKVLKGYPEIELVEIQGHTDDIGQAKANLKLSDERAQAVREFLISEGIDPSRLAAKGYGLTVPAEPIEGLRGRKLRSARDANRRVQFEILKRAEPKGD